MPFGDQSTEEIAGTARGRRLRSSARDASIDEILKSIQQIIDEEPLTMRDGSQSSPEKVAASRPVSKSAVAHFDGAGPKPMQRKRSARVMKQPSEDDVLAELLAPAEVPANHKAISETQTPLTDTTERSNPAVGVSATSHISATAIDTVAASDPEDTEKTQTSNIETVNASEVPTEASAHADLSVTADALLQSLAAGLGVSEIAGESPTAPSKLDPAPSNPGATDAAVNSSESTAGGMQTLAPVSPSVAPAQNDALDEDVVVSPTVGEAVIPAIEMSPPTAGTELLPPALANGLDDAIATMLRPLLREWLDAHLPRMVEKALKEELRERPLVSAGTAPKGSV